MLLGASYTGTYHLRTLQSPSLKAFRTETVPTVKRDLKEVAIDSLLLCTLFEIYATNEVLYAGKPTYPIPVIRGIQVHNCRAPKRDHAILPINPFYRHIFIPCYSPGLDRNFRSRRSSHNCSSLFGVWRQLWINVCCVVSFCLFAEKT